MEGASQQGCLWSCMVPAGNATCNAVPHVQPKHSCYSFHRVGSSVDDSKQCCQHCSQKCNWQEQQTAHPDPCIYELPVWHACNITNGATFTDGTVLPHLQWTVHCGTHWCFRSLQYLGTRSLPFRRPGPAAPPHVRRSPSGKT